MKPWEYILAYGEKLPNGIVKKPTPQQVALRFGIPLEDITIEDKPHQEPKRITWDQYFMDYFLLENTQTAILAKDGEIRSFITEKFLDVPLTLRAIAYAAHEGLQTYGTTLYVWEIPSLDCIKIAALSGVKRIVYSIGKPSHEMFHLCKDFRIGLVGLPNRCIV